MTLAVLLLDLLLGRRVVVPEGVDGGFGQRWFSHLSITADTLATLLLLLLVLLCASWGLGGGGSGRGGLFLLGLATALLLGFFGDSLGVGLALALVGAVDGGEGALLDGAGGGEWRG